MGPSIGGTVIFFTAACLFLFVRHRVHRGLALSELAAKRSEWIVKHPIQIDAAGDQQELSRRFALEHLVRVDSFLVGDCLRILRTEAEQSIPRMVPSYIPTHKKGKTLSYENIHRYAHGCLGLYHSQELQQWVSSIVGVDVHPTPDRDQSSLSVLCYHEPGDHINWHYDHNFYRGRHFTVLLSLANQSAAGGVSSSQLMRRTAAGDEAVDTAQNTLVLFEGSKVLHRASPTSAGDLRLMLSMTYCSDARTSWIKELARRVKDTAFYGIRALWD